MERPSSPWHVERDPLKLSYAFFLSHAAEDAESVRSLKSEIDRLSGQDGQPGLACFLDLDDWEKGRDPGQVIRTNLLRCEYMVAWVTPAYLRASRRGWIWHEFAYAELIELSLNARSYGEEFIYVVPVFRDVTIKLIERSPLIKFWLRRLFNPIPVPEIPDVARVLVDFYRQESRKRGLVPQGPSTLS